MNKCHIRAIEDRPGDKAGHKWQVNYNLTENYGWTGRKTFVTLEETRAYAKAKGWEDVSVQQSSRNEINKHLSLFAWQAKTGIDTTGSESQ